MGSVIVTTSALSIARELWRYGEPEAAERAFLLTPEAVADIGERMGELRMGDTESLWPGGPKDAYYMLAALELIAGRARPCRRNRRLPEKSLPVHMRATEEELWESVTPVAAVADARAWGTA